MSLEQSFITNVVEAALMAAGQPLSLDKLHSLFDEQQDVEMEHIKQALLQLGEDLGSRGVELKEVSSGYRIQAKQDFAPWLAKLWEEKPPRYSRAILETMVLIAYRQPITRGEIEDVRGVSVSSHIVKTLQERDWIRVVGHRDVPGRPALYATTKAFLDYFNLKSLDELPSLSEIKDLDSINAQLHLQEDGQAAGLAGTEASSGVEDSDSTVTPASAEPGAELSASGADTSATGTTDTDSAIGDETGDSDALANAIMANAAAEREEERSDALEAVDAALLSTKEVLERFERAVFHKEEALPEDDDLDVEDQREENAISEAVESLSHHDAEGEQSENETPDPEPQPAEATSLEEPSAEPLEAVDEDFIVVEDSNDVPSDDDNDSIEEDGESNYVKRHFESAEN